MLDPVNQPLDAIQKQAIEKLLIDFDKVIDETTVPIIEKMPHVEPTISK